MKKLLKINVVIAALSIALLSCTKQNKTSFAPEGGIGVISPSCGAIDMSPPNSLYTHTMVNFEVIPPTGTTPVNLQWTITKGTTTVFSTTNSTISRLFNGANEGVGSYKATATFQKANGNICALEKTFQILKDDTCVPPSGIGGPTIGYAGEETSPFTIDAEPCVNGTVAWDMDNDGTDEFPAAQTTENIVYTYTIPGKYTVKATVSDMFEPNNNVTLTHTIEVRGKTCINPFTSLPVATGESVEFAKTSSECGGKPCETTLRTCNNGVFDGDATFTQNPATCATTPECAATYAWQASEYGQCTGACESSNGTRAITNYACKKTVDGVTTTAPDAECVADIGAKPSGETESCVVSVEDQTLNCASCGSIPHNGTVTKWAQHSLCGVACLSQTQTCKNGTLPAFGAGYAYDSQSSCPVKECLPEYTYEWKVGEFGACSATQCGTQGVQTRPVTCVRNDGVTVFELFCSGAKPSTTKPCSARECHSCNNPFGGTLAHGQSVTAFGSSSVSCGQTCASESRVCNDGALSGSFTNATCSVGACYTESCKVQSIEQACKAAINNPNYTQHRIAPLNWRYFNMMGDAFAQGKTKPFSPFSKWWGWNAGAYKYNSVTNVVTTMKDGMTVDKNETMYCMGTYEDKDREYVRHSKHGYVLADVPDSDYEKPKAPQVTCRYPPSKNVVLTTTLTMKCTDQGAVVDPAAVTQNRILWENFHIAGHCGY